MYSTVQYSTAQHSARNHIDIDARSDWRNTVLPWASEILVVAWIERIDQGNVGSDKNATEKLRRTLVERAL